jgi:hypothetical protein
MAWTCQDRTPQTQKRRLWGGEEAEPVDLYRWRCFPHACDVPRRRPCSPALNGLWWSPAPPSLREPVAPPLGRTVGPCRRSAAPPDAHTGGSGEGRVEAEGRCGERRRGREACGGGDAGARGEDWGGDGQRRGLGSDWGRGDWWRSGRAGLFATHG